MIFLWIVLGVVGGLVGLIALCALFTIVISLFVKDKDYDKNSGFFRFLLYFWTVFGIITIRIKIKVTGNNDLPKGRILFVSNHRSKFDPILCWWIFRKYKLAFLSKKENFKVPFFGKIIRKCCFMAIDRENPRNAMKTIIRSAELIKKDEVSIGVYPEGTRSKTLELLPFHDGVFKIAKMAGCPVVAITAKGTENISKNFPKRKTEVCFDVVDVVSAEEVANLSTHEISARVRAKMIENLGE
ncbi:MAG: 1-acyl-sn-glycerol-3-phosphate acyltransferase [Clostridia bacterium]|nr:1-acyl-sn-glycerol-3-phosphate acyltransferase [Clostridia bacterium]